MKKLIMSMVMLMASLSANDNLRTGYSSGNNIQFHLKEAAFMVAFEDLSPDLKTRLDQMNDISANQKVVYILLNKGSYNFEGKGYYILKFVPVTDVNAVASFLTIKGMQI